MKLPLYIGGGILAAATNATIQATGGYASSGALVVIALSCGVFAGAVVIGRDWKQSPQMALVILAALVSGEAYNLITTGERIVMVREQAAVPLRNAALAHQEAVDRLAALEGGDLTSPRLALARAALGDAKAAVETEARDIRCGKECHRKQELADKAEAEVKAALPEAVAGHAKAIEAAKREVADHPVPPSSTPLADRLGWAPWVLDLLLAGLLSLGANGLAGALIAFGSHDGVPGIPANDVFASGFPTMPFPGNPPTGRRGRKSDPRILDFSESFREKHGRAPSGSEIKMRFPQLPTSTAYDYAKRTG